MRKAVFVLAVLSLSLPAFGRTASHRRLSSLTSATGTAASVAPVGDPALFRHVLAQAMKHRRVSHSGARIESIGEMRSVRTIFIPAAGSLQAGGGLFFKSDVTLINYNDTSQTVLAAFWPSGQSNLADLGITKQLTLPPNQAISYQDFVGNVIGTTGLGALAFLPVTGGNFDESGAIDALSRIYTKQPSSNGTVSQEFPGVDIDYVVYFDEAAALGLRNDSSFRTNYGILNVEDHPLTFRVRFIGERFQSETTVTVPAFAVTPAVAVPAGDYGPLTVVFTLQNTDPTTYLAWVGFASSTDNITGDGWVSISAADYNDSELTDIGY